MNRTGMMLVVSAVVTAVGCGSSRSAERDFPVDTELDGRLPGWFNGDCQAELRAQGVEGLCAVTELAGGGDLARPSRVVDGMLGQARDQLQRKLLDKLDASIRDCNDGCGNLSRPELKGAVSARLAAGAMGSVKGTRLAIGKSGVVKALFVLDAGSVVGVINKDPDLDAQAKQALINRTRDALKGDAPVAPAP